jgi:hypothetical protein
MAKMRQFANDFDANRLSIVIGSFVKALNELGIDYSLGARVYGHKMLDHMLSQGFPFQMLPRDLPALVEVSANLAGLLGMTIRGEAFTETSFTFHVENCVFSEQSGYTISTMKLEKPFCLMFGLYAALIERVTERVASVIDVDYSPKACTLQLEVT